MADGEAGSAPSATDANGAGGISPQLSSSKTRKGARKSRRVGRVLARIVLILLFASAFFLSVFPAGRAAARALYILPEVLSASQPGAIALGEEPIRHVTKTITASNGPVYLDVYEPTNAPPPLMGGREGIVVIPGVGDNRADPQLVNFSQAFARAGVVVMDMTTPTLINYALSVSDGDAVVQAVKTLERWPGVGAKRVGIIGFSAGDAPACFAAADPRIRDEVAFLALFGGYYNVTSLLRVVGSRSLVVDGQRQPWNPQYVPIQVLANTIAPELPYYEGQRLINALAPGGTPLSPDELASFSTDTVASYHLLRGDEPGRVDANLAMLSAPVRALLDSLSPSRVVSQIRAPIYLLHDRGDQFVPFTETRAFNDALNRLGRAHDFTEFGIFQHVEVRSNINIGQLVGDGLALFRVLDEILLPGS